MVKDMATTSIVLASTRRRRCRIEVNVPQIIKTQHVRLAAKDISDRKGTSGTPAAGKKMCREIVAREFALRGTPGARAEKYLIYHST